VLLVAHDTNMVVSTCSFRPAVFAIKSLLICISSWPFESLPIGDELSATPTQQSYAQYMGGVDRLDQMSRVNKERKRA
jgi:hypothetical protein